MHPEAGPIQDELEKVLGSPGFVRNERLSSFLRFIVERELEGKGVELKESLIGLEVFDRKPGYDPKQDSVVRTEAAKLRDRLSKYYASEGTADAIVIELPKGGYVPVFRRVELIAPKQRKPLLLKAVAAGILLLILTAAVWWWARQKNAPIRIAVLPLQNISPDSGDDYYSDGLTSELISDLSTVEGLAVRSQTSSFAFKGKPRNIREVGKQLAADYILEGSVLRSGRQLRINVRFIRVRDDSPLWSGKFDEEVTGALAIQDEIARGIVNSLRLTLGRGRRRYETSSEAYDLYLRARALPIQRGLAGYDDSIAILEEAISKDALFAPAYAGLATAYAARSNQLRLDIPEEMRKMREAAAEAVRLDPLLAEAHDALGMVYARDARWQDAETSFRRALQLDPSRSMTYRDFALYYLWPLSRIEEAIGQLRLAEEADPLSAQIQFSLGWYLTSAGHPDEAMKYCHKLPAEHPGRRQCIGHALKAQGKTEEAIQIHSASKQRSDVANLAYLYARTGRREEAERMAAEFTPRPMWQAVAFAGLGDKDRTLDALDKMAVVGPVRMGWILTLPELALLRGDPRVKQLRRKVGLPE